MDFHKSFFDELEKIAKGKSSYRDPEKDPKGDEEHWQTRRIMSSVLAGVPGSGMVGAAIGAREGRKLRSALGALAGAAGGSFLAGRLSGGLGARLGARLGGAAGAYLGHGKYNPEVAKREYKKMNA